MLQLLLQKTPAGSRFRLLLAFSAALLGGYLADAGPTAQPSAVPAAAPPAPMSGAQVIQVLDQTVDWYRTLGIQQQAANEPSDLLILYDNRQTATQVLGLAFDVARANA